MTERDLENLKHLPVPPPSERAKAAAINAALAAFNAIDAQLELPPQGDFQVVAPGSADAGSDATKGNAVPLRQTETSQPKRSFFMRISSRQNLALAASLAALMIAAPMAFRMTQREEQGTFGSVSTEIASRGGVTPTMPSPAPVDVARVEPVPHQSGGHVGEEGPKLALGMKQKAQEIARATAPGAQPRTSPVDSRAIADARRVDDGLAAKKSEDLERQAATTNPAEGPSAAPGDAKAKLSAGKQSMGADNAGPGTDFSGTLSPGNGGAFDGGSARAPTATAPAAPAAIASLESDSSARGRVANAPDEYATRKIIGNLRAEFKADPAKPRPQAWMGGDADIQPQIAEEENRDKFDAKEINPVKQVASEPVSTFSTDVDTASYAFVRRALNSGHLPPKDAVRVEEMINYFPYAYPAPDTAETPFKPTITVLPSPWNANNKLVHVAIKGYDLKSAERPRANLVLLMDVSGSMGPADRLPLIKNAFRLLVDRLKPDDTVGIVTYASGSGIALEPTKVSDKSKILAAIDRLSAGGSTAGAAGIADAYRLAEAGFEKSAVNRVILATDGDFNVGITDQNELRGFIERKRQSGIFLSILGVGQGNHNDALMQTLAQNGNGTAAYVDTLNEARKVLVDESSSTLFTIAKDVKVQIEWNPAAITEYRLVGYETRALKREDFNNDRIDAGDIGSGHTVTAIYEVTPVGAPRVVEDLRYGKKVAAEATLTPAPAKDDAASKELGFLQLRYKRPNEDTSQLISLPIESGLDKKVSEIAGEVRFSTAVAAFGQLLKGEPFTQGYTFDDVLTLAQSARGDDPFGYRAEFLNLVRLAKSARP